MFAVRLQAPVAVVIIIQKTTALYQCNTKSKQLVIRPANALK